ncbi:arylacetamide deacetylase-like 4 [Paramuricea clavata]|uniref:Arylacetamide deacetylase-like 4, partial n=1 Tax=Paramuricea clavata TaxID=317549 RepID=A0A6S7H6H2_PARCT|nr:arylacetamide deacetylase-like 4 [Paramuricea clavata]
MLRKGLTIIVALFAVLSGLIWYNAYLPISPKLKGDQKLIPFLFNFNNELGQIVDDKLGLVAKYKWYRWFFSAISTSNSLLVAKGITITDSVISGIPVKIFRPELAKEGERQYRPGLIFFHGGGLIFGSVNWTCYIQQCIMIAQDTKSVVISVEYRLAPEHPFPAQFEDCYSVVNTVTNEPRTFGILNNKIALAGDSAGGQLAAAISLNFAKQNRSSELVGQVLIYPLLQLIDTLCLPSFQKYKLGFQMDEEQTAYLMSVATTGNGDMKQEYLNGNVTRYFMRTPFWQFLEIPETSNCEVYKDSANITLPSDFVSKVTDPRFSPLLAKSVEGSPPTLLMIAEYDVLASEGILYGKRLGAAGVPTVIKVFKTYHAFLNRLSIPFINTPIAKQGMEDTVNFLNSVFYR